MRTVLCFCCLLAASTSADFEPTAHERYVGSTERIRGFDPITSSDTTSMAAICKVYEGLYEYEYLVRAADKVAPPNLSPASEIQRVYAEP